MSTQVAIYIYAFLGMTAFMGLFAGLICHRHRKMVNQHRAYERMAQERMQQVQEENLPPFYIDHVRDRACVFEGELPPDNFPRALEVVVVRPRRQESMEDLFAATSGGAPGATGTAGTGTDAGTAAVTEGPRRNNTSMDPPDLIGSAVPHLGISVVESGTIRPVPVSSSSSFPSSSIRRPMRAMTSSSGSRTSALAAAVLLPPPPPPQIPTVAVPVHADDDNSVDIVQTLGDGQDSVHSLPPPPSYDIFHTLSPASEQSDHIVRPANAPPTTSDYFSHHPCPPHPPHNSHHQHTQQQQQQQLYSRPPQASTPSLVIEQQDPSLVETPRYSDEFPSHIPHEQHLEGYRRARALSNVSLQQLRQPYTPMSPPLLATVSTAATASEPASISAQSMSSVVSSN